MTMQLKTMILSCLMAILLWGGWVTPSEATGVVDLPPLSMGSNTWIVDQAEAISRSNEGFLQGKLANLAKKTQKEVRMVVIRRLDFGQSIEQFANELFTTWYPSPESQENQVLVVLDTLSNDTAMITGAGVKSILSEDITQSIIKETMGVPLKEGSKYNEALLEANERLSAVLSGEPDPGPPEVKSEINIESTYVSAENVDRNSSTIWVVVLLILATVIPMVTYFWYQKT